MREKEKKSPIIILPDDENIRKQLELKLREYKSRFRPCIDPRTQMQIICNSAILGQLLQYGQVKTWDISLEISEMYPGAYDSVIFNNACAMIGEYCRAGIRGTGMPPRISETASKRLRRGYPPFGSRVRLTKDFQFSAQVCTPKEEFIINETGVTKVEQACLSRSGPTIPAGSIGIVGEGPFSRIIFDYNFECPVQFFNDPRIPRTVGVPWNILEFAD